MNPLLYSFVFRRRSVPATSHALIQAVLRAASKLGAEEQPELYRHVHPHGHATAKLARAFATAIRRAAGLNNHALDEIELGAHLHDFGKYLISKSILLKPGTLTEDERAVVSLHPVYGAQVLAGVPAITERVLAVVLYHHERWDGTGYPEGLRGERIPFAARLVSIIDVYTSLRSKRTYKPSLTRREAAVTIEEMAGYALDPAMTESFLKFIGAG